MHSNVTIKNVSWPHFSWTTLYILSTLATKQVKKSLKIGRDFFGPPCSHPVVTGACVSAKNVALVMVFKNGYWRRVSDIAYSYHLGLTKKLERHNKLQNTDTTHGFC